MSRRTFMMLAHQYNPSKHWANGWFWSEKWDGIRAFWDGGITRGLFSDQVPWANTAKDARFKERPVATGLWSRYGKVIHAPSWWLDQLPKIPLDGELWSGHGFWQRTNSIVSRINPTDDWQMIKFMVLDYPPYQQILRNGVIKEIPNFEKELSGCEEWAMMKCEEEGVKFTDPLLRFELRYKRLLSAEIENDVVEITPQFMLSRQTPVMQKEIEYALQSVIDKGGEGIMLRHHSSFWVPNRVHELLKYKPFQDAEGKVVGYTWGRETDKGSRLLGKMGALVVEYEGKEFQLSGFTDAERELAYTKQALADYDRDQLPSINELGQEYEGGPVGWTIENPAFPRGSTVTFKYRELSDDGIPKEARYWRKGS